MISVVTTYMYTINDDARTRYNTILGAGVFFGTLCAGTTFEGGKGENAPTLPPPHPGVAIDTQTPMCTGI